MNVHAQVVVCQIGDYQEVNVSFVLIATQDRMAPVQDPRLSARSSNG